jgi:hypothetical protein
MHSARWPFSAIAMCGRNEERGEVDWLKGASRICRVRAKTARPADPLYGMLGGKASGVV